MYTHTCLKCHQSYQDTDIEPFYCEPCNAERKVIAAQIDAQRASMPKKAVVKSDFQIAQEKGQTRGEGLFVRASDLGINFN